MGIAELFAPVKDEIEQVEVRLAEAITPAATESRELAAYASRHQGKRLRPGLLLLAGKVCGRLTPHHVDLATIVELIHLASLVHDDVVDQADLRRRAPSVRTKWGNELAVLFGDFAFSKAFCLLASLDSPWATSLLSRTAHRMCEGEMRQLFRRFDPSLSEAEYLEIIEAKTAELFDASCRLGAGASGATGQLGATLGAYGRLLGLAFQIADDCLDIAGDESRVGKTLYTDLENGWLTLPVIHVLSQAAEPAGERLTQLLFPPSGPLAKAAIADVMAEHDALRYSCEAARRYSREAKSLLRHLPRTECKTSLLGVADYIVDREG